MVPVGEAEDVIQETGDGSLPDCVHLLTAYIFFSSVRLRLCYYYCMVLFSFAGSQTVQHLLGVSFYALYLEYRWCL